MTLAQSSRTRCSELIGNATYRLHNSDGGYHTVFLVSGGVPLGIGLILFAVIFQQRVQRFNQGRESLRILLLHNSPAQTLHFLNVSRAHLMNLKKRTSLWDCLHSGSKNYTFGSGIRTRQRA